MSNNGELHIRKSASRDLEFAIEHGVIRTEPVYVDDNAEIIATVDLRDSWNQLIADCERDLRTLDELKPLGRVSKLENKVDDMQRRVEALGEAVRSGANQI